MTGFFHAFYWFFVTWWGLVLMAALDSTMAVFLPFGVDALVIYMTARNNALFWLYPILATVGSNAGTALTYWMGRKIGDVGLERFFDERRLTRLRERVNEKAAIALAVPALLPPPFPLTPVVLTCGALQVDAVRFFGWFTAMRLLRFTVEALLALVYGRGILRVLESDAFQSVIIGFIVLAVLGTVISGAALWRKTRPRPALS